MNYKMMARVQSHILLIGSLLMIPSLLIAIFTQDASGIRGFLSAINIGLICTFLLRMYSKDAKKGFHTKEGLVSVGLSWIVLSLVGCLPFFISGQIPNFIDAFFEIVSGFTTTGASILPDVEALTKSMLWWRSFSHWIGGMGILVFFLALVPIAGKNDGSPIHLLRAESPGPKVEKMTPKIKDSAKILYIIYFVLTIIDIILLLICGLPLFDACCIAFGTAGTGGFGITSAGLAGYSHAAQNVTTLFMFLFGINFSMYYLLLLKKFKQVIGDEELRLYIGIVVTSIVLIFFNILGKTADTMTISDSLRHAAFQVSSIITTTGYSTTDFNLWPTFSKAIILLLMVSGACAGSTGGGIKVMRILVLFKAGKRNLMRILHPNKIMMVKVNKRKLDDKLVSSISGYFILYAIIIILSFLIISLNPGDQSITTHFSAVMATFNNIGPGLDAVGPTANFSLYNNLNTLILSLDMLLGRLEIYPILILLVPNLYKK